MSSVYVKIVEVIVHAVVVLVVVVVAVACLHQFKICCIFSFDSLTADT